jgi:hypothetical protein
MKRHEWDKLLDEEPGNWDLRLAYATWLHDEKGQCWWAAFQMWLIENRHHPDPYYRRFPDKNRWGPIWYWSDCKQYATGESLDPDALPTEIFNAIDKTKYGAKYNGLEFSGLVKYTSRISAERALKDALKELNLLTRIT